MLLTAELSLYPLHADYEPPIRAFIAQLAEHNGLTLQTNSMSTQLSGDSIAVLTAVGEALAHSHAQYGMQVLVCKFIPGMDLLSEER
jgi:uncharacterized protein YqgV (UPF0045/DUF77 family)